VFSTNDVKKHGGAIALGGLGLALGLLAIDHHFAPKGSSLATRMFGGAKRAMGSHHAGADAGSLDTARLPPYAQQVLAHALAAEIDQTTLSQLAQNLQAAGFTQAASQVRAKVHG
jgi:hypothetical protein